MDLFDKLLYDPAPICLGVALFVLLGLLMLKVSARRKVLASGSLLVTNVGEAALEEPLSRINPALTDINSCIVVEFDPNEPPPPPCAGGSPDVVDWELEFKHCHTGVTTARLKIKWRVTSARTIVWRILEPRS